MIGDSILRNVQIESQTPATVTFLPGARAPDIEANLKFLAKKNKKFSKIIVHVGTNDVHMRQSEITKCNIASAYKQAQEMCDEVIFSGPLPVRRNNEIYSRLISFNIWLSNWCKAHNLCFVDNWPSFFRQHGLLKRDEIHPSQTGACLLSRNRINALDYDSY